MAVFGNGVVGFLPGQQAIGEIEVRVGKVGLQAKSFPILFGRFIAAVLSKEHIAKMVVERGIVGFEAQQVGVLLCGRVEFAILVQEIGQTVQAEHAGVYEIRFICEGVRGGLERAAELGNGGAVVVLCEVEVDEGTAGGEVSGRKDQEVFPFADGLFEVLVAQEGFGEAAARGVVVGREADGFTIFGELGGCVVLREIESGESDVKVGVRRLEAHGCLKFSAGVFQIAEEGVLASGVEPGGGEVRVLP